MSPYQLIEDIGLSNAIKFVLKYLKDNPNLADKIPMICSPYIPPIITRTIPQKLLQENK
jgi:hypothetical protein